MSPLRPLAVVLVLVLALVLDAVAAPLATTPAPDVGVDQKLGAEVPLDARFVTDEGAAVALRDVLGKRPVILALVYYRCPMLCNLVLNGIEEAARTLRFDAGKEFDIVAVSIDPAEDTDVAATKKHSYVKHYGRPGTDGGWRFLTGKKPAIDALASAVGFRYAWDAASGQYAHGSAIMILTPGGKVSRYFYGVEYSARDVRLGLVEASEGKIGTLADRIVLLCFQYDPMSGKYGFVVMSAVRIGGAITAIALAAFIFINVRRDRRRAVPAC
jgi:protein SCO1/2